jgi:hypothetical protein
MLRMLVKMTLIYHTCVLMRALVPAPPAGWARPYAAMAREDQLAWLTLDDVTKAALWYRGGFGITPERATASTGSAGTAFLKEHII